LYLAQYRLKLVGKLRHKYLQPCSHLCHHLPLSLRLSLNLDLNLDLYPSQYHELFAKSCRSLFRQSFAPLSASLSAALALGFRLLTFDFLLGLLPPPGSLWVPTLRRDCGAVPGPHYRPLPLTAETQAMLTRIRTYGWTLSVTARRRAGLTSGIRRISLTAMGASPPATMADLVERFERDRKACLCVSCPRSSRRAARRQVFLSPGCQKG